MTHDKEAPGDAESSEQSTPLGHDLTFTEASKVHPPTVPQFPFSSPLEQV